MLAEGLVSLEHVGADAAVAVAHRILDLVAGLHVFDIGEAVVVAVPETDGSTGLGNEGEPGGDLGRDHEVEIGAEALAVADVLAALETDHRVHVVAAVELALLEGAVVAVLIVRRVERDVLAHIVHEVVVRVVGRVGADVEVGGEGQPLGEIDRVVGTDIDLRIVGVPDGTVLLVVGEGEVAGVPVVLAHHGEVIVLEHGVLHDQAAPVGIIVQDGGRECGPEREVVDQVRLGIAEILTVIGIELLRVHQLLTGKVRGDEADVGLEVELQLVGFRLLGGDDDHAAVGLRTVHTGRAGVLEDGDGLHVVGIVGATDDTVNHVERFLRSVQGGSATDADGRLGTGTAAVLHHGHTGHLALEHVTDVVADHVLELVGGHRGHGAGNLATGLGAVTHHDDLVDQLGIHIKRDVDDASATDGDFGRLEADRRKDQGGTGVADADGIVAIDIRYGTVQGSFLKYTGAHHRQAVVSGRHDTLDHHLGGHDQCRKQQKTQK